MLPFPLTLRYTLQLILELNHRIKPLEYFLTYTTPRIPPMIPQHRTHNTTARIHMLMIPLMILIHCTLEYSLVPTEGIRTLLWFSCYINLCLYQEYFHLMLTIPSSYSQSTKPCFNSFVLIILKGNLHLLQLFARENLA